MTEAIAHLTAKLRPARIDQPAFVLRYVQPGLVGLIDGTLSTLAPIFAAALLAGSRSAPFVGLATALGAGISMGSQKPCPPTAPRQHAAPGSLVAS
jgi:hypothetical protein